MLKKLALLLLLFISVLSTDASAKWWIFGQSEETVATRYLYLNDISFNELDQQVTLYRDLLPDGRVILRGKAQSGKSQIGKIEISLDNRESWQPARKDANGSFEFSFTPELNKTYDLYVKILNTTGKSNEIDETYRQLTVSDSDIESIIRTALDSMVQAYMEENPRAFMASVNPDFAGDYAFLDKAIRQDFGAFDGLQLAYTLNNVASGSGGKVYVALSYNRLVTSAYSGETLSDKGLTEFTFSLNGNRATVLSMKNPLIFGLSDAANVATGTVNSSENDSVLAVGPDGTLDLVPVTQVGDDSFGGVIPAPENLTIVSFSYPDLEMHFDIPAGISEADYDRVIQWSTSPSGPWLDDDMGSFIVGTFNQFTVHCRPEIWTPATIYYRIAFERKTDSERGAWSNLIFVP